MKRDMDLVRSILFKIEEALPGRSLGSREFARLNHSHQELLEHLLIMHERELIRGHAVKSTEGVIAFQVFGLTWEGHEFLDAARNDTFWNEAKKRLANKGVSAGIEVLGPVLIKIAKEAMGL